MNNEELNNVVEYHEVLTNCGARISFDPHTLQSQLKYYKNWQNIILKRHHQFVLSYLNNNFNLKKVKESLGYPIKDLESILLRVQSQFEMYEENNDIIFKDMYISVYNKGVFSNNIKEKKENPIVSVLQDILFTEIEIPEENEKEEVIEENIIIEENTVEQDIIVKEIKNDSEKIYSDYKNDKEFFKSIITNHTKFVDSYLENNKKIVRKDKINNLIELLSKIDNIEKYKDIFTDKIYNSVCLLMDGMDVETISKQLKINKYYLTQILVGKENPRCVNEKGIIMLLQEYIDKE